MNNNDLFQASRRRFLAQLGGLTVAGMLGPSLLTAATCDCGASGD
ncbi:trimethylamine-N-oxide reductase precursor [Escherichia coli]|nr:trimethylamine-N-oxide reductase precursor [Escherichia coli]